MLQNAPEGALEPVEAPEFETVDPSTLELPAETPETAPEPPAEAPPAPEAASPAPAQMPDMAAQVQALIAQQQANLQFQQQQAEAAQRAQLEAQQRASAPKPLLDQPEWTQRYSDAQSRAAYEPEAALTVARMNAELMQEQVAQQMGAYQQQMNLQFQAGTMLSRAATEQAAQSNGLITNAEYEQAVSEAFGGNQAAIAQAIGNPQLQEQLRYMAIGRKIAAGGQPAPARPAPPAPVQPASRQPAPTTPANTKWATDAAYRNSVIQDAFLNPDKYRRTK